MVTLCPCFFEIGDLFIGRGSVHGDEALKSWLRFLLLCILSAACLWLVIQGVNLQELVSIVIGADRGFLLLTILLTISTLFVRALRWQIILPSPGKTNLIDLFVATGIGMTAINLLPARLGEVVRAYTLSVRTGMSFSTTLATIVVERVLDLAAIILALGIVFFKLSIPEWVQVSVLVLVLICAVTLMILVFLNKYTEKARFIVHRSLMSFSPKWTSRINNLLTLFVEGLSILRKGNHLLAALGWTFVLWILFGLGIATTLLALSIPATPLSVLTVLAVLTLGLAVPSGPGFVGTFEFFATFSLGLAGVPRAPALSFALIFHAALFLTTVTLGVVCLWVGGFGRGSTWGWRSFYMPLSSDANSKARWQ